MKKIIILLSVITLASCSLLPNNGENDNEAIKKAQQTAQENISQYTDQEIARAKKKFGINKLEGTSSNFSLSPEEAKVLLKLAKQVVGKEENKLDGTESEESTTKNEKEA